MRLPRMPPRSSHVVETTRTDIGIMYKPTLFDRYGPDAGNIMRALSYAGVVFGLTVPLFSAASLKLEPPLPFGWTIVWILCGSTGSSALACLAGLAVSSTSGALMKRVALDGASTPYREQYSYQQTLVMQGRIDDALASFEAVIAERPDAIDPRIKAAELYSREKGDHHRASRRRVRRERPLVELRPAIPLLL